MNDRYAPLEDYALLANGFSTALISRDGSLDWACLRRFDRPSCFGRLLDADRGGYFNLATVDGERTRRSYIDGSLVLQSQVKTATGTATVTEALLAVEDAATGRHRLVRRITGTAGHCRFRIVLEPRLDYGQLRPLLRRHDEGVVSAVGADEALIITTPEQLEIDEQRGRITGDVEVTDGDCLWLVVESQPAHRIDIAPLDSAALEHELQTTITGWQRWSERTRARGTYVEHARSCAAVLRGLACPETGAIVAAATASLPERIGGNRNWDYRYSWIRDSALTLTALERLGHAEIGRAYRDFLLRSAAGNADDLQIVYGPYGERWLGERELDLEGYRGSRPVRVGNAATAQVQLDVYGYIVDLAARDSRAAPDRAEWRFLRSVIEAAVRRWSEPDQGLWESRGPARQYTHSKALVWLALDRGVSLARRHGLDGGLDSWARARDELRACLEQRGVGTGGWFTQTLDDPRQAVDASLLQLPLLDIIDANDDRMLRTVDRICDRLGTSEGFIHRYETAHVDDGVGGGESTFLLCSFWLVEVLALQHRTREARQLFERLLNVANDLRLFAEQYDPATEELRGNYPQAFTHLAMINAGERLAKADGE